MTEQEMNYAKEDKQRPEMQCKKKKKANCPRREFLCCLTGQQQCSVEKLPTPEGVSVVYDGMGVYSNKRSQVIRSPTSYPITIGRGKKIGVGKASEFNMVLILGTSTKISETLLIH